MNLKHSFLIGHQAVWQKLIQQLEKVRVPHALLFLGIEGIGKKKLALKLSQNILGLKEENFSQLIEEKHPDFIWVKPEKNRIKIEAIREISQQLSFAPFQAPNRVILIEDAHCMNTSAANALLKSLEEPSPNNYFILITHALGWLPKTIISRTQKVYFSPLKREEIQQILDQEEVSYSEEEMNTAMGSPLKVIQNQELKTHFIPQEKIFCTNSRDGLSFSAASQLSEKIAQNGQTELFLQNLLENTHQKLTQKVTHSEDRFDYLTFADRILELKAKLRLNLNAKMHLTRLLLYFQESKKSRL